MMRQHIPRPKTALSHKILSTWLNNREIDDSPVGGNKGGKSLHPKTSSKKKKVTCDKHS